MIIYDDEHVRTIWYQGTSDFVLITFGDRVALADGERFYADGPVKKAGISCLGLMAKGPNWFPPTSVQKAYKAAESLVTDFSSRLTYGGSMGGYAALKFSRLFQATGVIAFSPQWSINQEECDGVNPGWTCHFEPWMGEMGIKTQDVSGDVYLFVDVLDAKDDFHQRKIVDAYSSTTLIKVPWCGHHVTNTLAGTSNLTALIDHVRGRHTSRIVELVSRVRRRSRAREYALLRSGFRSMPGLVSKILVARGNDPYEQKLALEFGKGVVALLFDRARPAEARAFFSRFYSHFLLEDRASIELMAAFYAAGQQSQLASSFQLKTHRGTFLAFDAAAGTCIHIDVERSGHKRQHFPVTCNVLGDSAHLLISSSGYTYRLAPRSTRGELGVVLNDQSTWSVSYDNLGRIQFSWAQHFLSAWGESEVACNRVKAGRWESFDVRPTSKVLRLAAE